MVSIKPETEDYTLITKDAPKELEEGGQNTIDELIEANLGTKENPRLTFTSASLPPRVQEKLKTLLLEYVDCFAWNYHEMPGLDPEVTVHNHKIDPEFKPVKQAPRRMQVELE